MAQARHIFVGDVQGCREELELLLERVAFDPAADELHPVGDLVNRGPDSAGCLRLLRGLDTGRAGGVVGGVLGNHDLALLATARGLREERPGDTLRGVLEADDRAELLDWLAARPFVRVIDSASAEGGSAVAVHAGFSPAWLDPIALLSAESVRPPGNELGGGALCGPAARFAVQVRSCDASGALPASREDPAPAPYRPWHAWFDRSRVEDRTVVFGHWARQGLLAQDGFRGLDTGCVWGRELTAWILEEDRLVSVPARRAYARIS